MYELTWKPVLFCAFSDNLLKNLVQDALEWDKEDNHNKQKSQRTQSHLDALVKCINSCGVCFSLGKKKCGWKRECDI